MELPEFDSGHIARLRNELGWSSLPDEPLLFWSSFEEENAERLPYVARLLEELKARKSCIHDLFCARQYAQSGNIPYVLDCLDFMLDRYDPGELATLPSAAWHDFFETVIVRNAEGTLEALELSPFDQIGTITHRFIAPDHYVYIFDGLFEVAGELAFLSRVISSLALLKHRARADYDEIANLVGQIIQSHQDGFTVDQKPPSYAMTLETAQTSISWCASCIAREAHHSRLYQSFERRYPGKVVPENIYSGPEVELECDSYQLRIAESIGAAKPELEYLRALDDSSRRSGTEN